MFQVYLKVAFRSLLKNRLFTGINLAGLSIGLAAGLLMLLWTQDELTFDNFHPDSERIFRENAHLTTGGKTQSWAAVPAPHAFYALQEIPEVEKAVRIDGDADHPVSAMETIVRWKKRAHLWTVHFLRSSKRKSAREIRQNPLKMRSPSC